MSAAAPVIPVKTGIQFGAEQTSKGHPWTPAPQGHFLRGASAGVTVVA